jgi:hypothetical protein
MEEFYEKNQASAFPGPKEIIYNAGQELIRMILDRIEQDGIEVLENLQPDKQNQKKYN